MTVRVSSIHPYNMAMCFQKPKADEGRSSAVPASSLPYADNQSFEKELGQMLDKLCGKKKAKLCKDLGISEQSSEWTREQCFSALRACVQRKDLGGAVQVFRQWYAFLMQTATRDRDVLEREKRECDEKIAKLTQECANYKLAAVSAQKACGQAQNSIKSLRAKIEVMEKQAEKLSLPKSKKIQNPELLSSNDFRLDPATITYKLLSPPEVDRIAKDFKHPREIGMAPFLTQLTRKIQLYNFHPLDIIAICSQVFLPKEVDKLRAFYGSCVEQQKITSVQECTDGLVGIVRTFVDRNECWRKVVDCQQRKNESVMEFTQRYAQVFLMHGGSGFGSIDDVASSCIPVAQWADGLTPDLRKVLPLLKPEWRKISLNKLSDSLSAYERDSNMGKPRSVRHDVCHYCHKPGHWQKACRKKRADMKKQKCNLNSGARQPDGSISPDVAGQIIQLIQRAFQVNLNADGDGKTKEQQIWSFLMDMYASAPVLEVWSWVDEGASLDSAGAWRIKGGKYVAPEALLADLAQQFHSVGHADVQTMVHRFSSTWWSPKFRAQASDVVRRCVPCQECRTWTRTKVAPCPK